MARSRSGENEAPSTRRRTRARQSRWTAGAERPDRRRSGSGGLRLATNFIDSDTVKFRPNGDYRAVRHMTRFELLAGSTIY